MTKLNTPNFGLNAQSVVISGGAFKAGYSAAAHENFGIHHAMDCSHIVFIGLPPVIDTVDLLGGGTVSFREALPPKPSSAPVRVAGGLRV